MWYTIATLILAVLFIHAGMKNIRDKKGFLVVLNFLLATLLLVTFFTRVYLGAHGVTYPAFDFTLDLASFSFVPPSKWGALQYASLFIAIAGGIGMIRTIKYFRDRPY